MSCSVKRQSFLMSTECTIILFVPFQITCPDKLLHFDTIKFVLSSLLWFDLRVADFVRFLMLICSSSSAQKS